MHGPDRRHPEFATVVYASQIKAQEMLSSTTKLSIPITHVHQFYFNDGIHVDGASINLPKEIEISTSHATSLVGDVKTLRLLQTDRANNLWTDQFGYQWEIIGNTIRQITIPEYIISEDEQYGILHGPDRYHSEFSSVMYAEQIRAPLKRSWQIYLVDSNRHS